MTFLLSRRRLLAGTGPALALVTAACAGDGSGGGGGVDLDFAAEAAGVERLALDHYTWTATLLTGGKVGALVPAAVAELVASAVGQHRQAHDAWNTLLTDAGRAAAGAPQGKLQEALNAAGIRVTDIPTAAALALRLEDYACQTYQRALPELQGPDAIRLAAEVSVVGHQRQSVLRYLLGLDPVGSGTTPGPAGLAPAAPSFELITG